MRLINKIFDKKPKITQKFGNLHPIINGKKHYNFYSKYNSPGGHNGIDLVPTNRNNSIYAPIDFKIVFLANNYRDGYGAYIKGIFTYGLCDYYIYFCHLDTWEDKLSYNSEVKEKDLIAIMGGSGNGQRYGFSPHLHFGIKPVDKIKQKNFSMFAGYVNPSIF